MTDADAHKAAVKDAVMKACTAHATEFEAFLDAALKEVKKPRKYKAPTQRESAQASYVFHLEYAGKEALSDFQKIKLVDAKRARAQARLTTLCDALETQDADKMIKALAEIRAGLDGRCDAYEPAFSAYVAAVYAVWGDVKTVMMFWRQKLEDGADVLPFLRRSLNGQTPQQFVEHLGTEAVAEFTRRGLMPSSESVSASVSEG